MADKQIRREFVEGMHLVFSTLFNNGDEGEDGVFLYLMSEDTVPLDPYGENKYKKYQFPKLLICKAVLNPIQGEQDVLGIDIDAQFTVPIKSLTDNGLEVTQKALNEMYKGVMRFHDTFYQIDKINPKAYVEDTFLFYEFCCTELKDFDMETNLLPDFEEESLGVEDIHEDKFILREEDIYDESYPYGRLE